MDALKSAGRAIIRSPSIAKQSWASGRHKTIRHEDERNDVELLGRYDRGSRLEIQRRPTGFSYGFDLGSRTRVCSKLFVAIRLTAALQRPVALRHDSVRSNRKYSTTKVSHVFRIFFFELHDVKICTLLSFVVISAENDY
ncbi:low density lipoprotein receptor adapter protein 1 isoform X1 [Tachysurus ichikawai]